ncbi:glycosyltransferase [Neobacillus drentensis]|uniref:glycosyltransferase n=1 Tax=Neobacillus drentensis TaxID=220684 RepID=UPI001F188176|nr:glycosyltransferase [Neobacillus drentensis]ULT55098.1 glycosyltransferase [Neobacillus drentensis]
MKKQLVSCLAVFTIAITTSHSLAWAEGRPAPQRVCINQSVIQLKYPMQKLWIEHAWWTRSFIVSSLAGLKDQNDVLARLLQNQVDLGNIIKPYYGEQARDKLTSLLKEHILIAGKIIEAAKAGDQAKFNQFNKDWIRNADEIVAFLTNANPNWNKQVLADMFYTHLKLTIAEVEYRLKGEWAADIKTADTIETHLIHMGDFLTDGIVKQFPNRFR